MSGQKVTTDPASKLTNPEKPGEILSDSLAAESIKSSGGFSQNPGAAISGQSAAGSTTANQDTSGATRLEPAESAAVRSTADQEANDKAEAAKGSSSGGKGGYQTIAGPNAGSRAAGTAPSYVHSGSVGDGKPAGEGLKEGGFSKDAPNASFGTDIGGKNDPGRLATQKFAAANATSGGFAEAGRDAKISGDGQFDVLKDAPA